MIWSRILINWTGLTTLPVVIPLLLLHLPHLVLKQGGVYILFLTVKNSVFPNIVFGMMEFKFNNYQNQGYTKKEITV